MKGTALNILINNLTWAMILKYDNWIYSKPRNDYSSKRNTQESQLLIHRFKTFFNWRTDGTAADRLLNGRNFKRTRNSFFKLYLLEVISFSPLFSLIDRIDKNILKTWVAVSWNRAALFRDYYYYSREKPGKQPQCCFRCSFSITSSYDVDES